MSVHCLLNNSGFIPGRSDRSTLANGFENGSAPATPNDLAWQHAMEHAQQGDLPDWFKAFLPNNPDALRGNQGIDGIALASMLFSSQLHVSPQLNAGMQLAPTALATQDAGQSHGNAVFGVNGTGAQSGATQNGAEPGKAAITVSSAHSLQSPDTSRTCNAQPMAGGAAKISDATMAETLSARFGLTFLPVASIEYFAGSSSSSDLLALPVNSASGPGENLASILNTPATQDDTEVEPGNSSGPSLADAVTDVSTNGNPSQEPVRLYAEWTTQGVRIWLGADGSQNLPLAQLTQQLQQWLTGQGERLVTLVCNGRLLWQMNDEAADISSVSGTGGSSAAQLNSSVVTPQETEFSKFNLLSPLSQPNQENPWQSVQ